MSEGNVVGLRPWLPWPLSRSRWWTEPVRAERLAALRIGLAATLLVDLLSSYAPHVHDFFGERLGTPALSSYWTDWATYWRWSLLRNVTDGRVVEAALWVFVAATACLLLGFATRICAAVTWVLSLSFANVNPFIDNAGDLVRGIALFYLMLTPCGAAWSLDRWIWRRGGGPTFVYPWALRLLFVQMALIYCTNGMYKVLGADWRSGNSLYYVMGDLTLARWSYAQFPLPYPLTRLLTWSVLVWELSFPLLVWWRRTRVPALWCGVAFHIGIGTCLEVGGFVPYMLCLYLPLVPWERWVDRLGGRPVAVDS
jgi:hypothetical protein